MTDSRLAMVRARLVDMLEDPFWRQVIRDAVPHGCQITPALHTERTAAVVLRAVADSGGPLGFAAVLMPGQDTPVLLRVEQEGVAGDVAQFRLVAPGYPTRVTESPGPDAPIGDVVLSLVDPTDS